MVFLLAWPFICLSETQRFTLCHELIGYILSHGVCWHGLLFVWASQMVYALPWANWLYFVSWCFVGIAFYLFGQIQNVYALPWAIWLYFVSWCFVGIAFCCLVKPKMFTLSHELFDYILSHGVLLALPFICLSKTQMFTLSHELFDYILFMVFCWHCLLFVWAKPKRFTLLDYLTIFCFMVFCWHCLLFV